MSSGVLWLVRNQAQDIPRVAHAVKSSFIRKAGGQAHEVLDASFNLQDVAVCITAVARDSALAESLPMRRAFDDRVHRSLRDWRGYKGLLVAQALKAFADVRHVPRALVRAPFFHNTTRDSVQGSWLVCVSLLRSLSQLGAAAAYRDALCTRLLNDPGLKGKPVAEMIDLYAILRTCPGAGAQRVLEDAVCERILGDRGALSVRDVTTVLRSSITGATAKHARAESLTLLVAALEPGSAAAADGNSGPQSRERAATGPTLANGTSWSVNDLAAAVWAASAHGIAPPEWMLRELYENLEHLTPVGLVSVLHALAKMHSRLPRDVPLRFFTKLRVVLARMPEGADPLAAFDGKSLSTLLWAHATVRVRNEALLAASEAHLASPSVVMRLTMPMVANALWAYAVLEHRPVGALRMLEASMGATKSVEAVDGKTAARLAWAAVMLQLKTRFLAQLFAVKATVWWEGCAPCDAVAILWACVKVRAGVAKGRMCDELLRAGGTLNRTGSADDHIAHLPRLLWVYSALRVAQGPHNAVIRGAADNFTTAMHRASVENMAKFARALASLGSPAARLPFFECAQPLFLKHAASKRLSDDTCCTVVYAYSKTRLTNDVTHPLCQALAPHLSRNLPQLTHTQTAGLVSALTRMRYPLPRGLADVLAAQVADIPPTHVLSVLWALSVMSQAAGFHKALSERVDAAPQAFGEHLERVSHRLAVGWVRDEASGSEAPGDVDNNRA